MEAYRKIGAFLTILAILASGLYLAAGDYILELIQPDEDLCASVERMALGEDGCIYLTSVNDGINVIYKLDGAGNVIQQAEMPGLEDARQHIIWDIYASSQGRVFFSVYSFDDEDRFIGHSSLYTLSEDFGEVTRLRDASSDGETYHHVINEHRVLGMSEHEGDTLVLVADEDVYTLCIYQPQDSEFRSVGAFSFEGQCVSGVALNKEQVLLSMQGGRLVKCDVRRLTYSEETYDDMILSQMMNGGEYVYFIEGRSGTLGRISPESGRVTAWDEPSYLILDYKQFRMNGSGGIAAIIDDNQLFTADVREGVRRDVAVSDNSKGQWKQLIFFGIVIGTLLAAFLIWHWYVNVMKMHMSMLVRQCILIIMIVGVVINVLLMELMQNSISAMLSEHLTNRMKTMATLLATTADVNENQYATDIDLLAEELTESSGMERERLGFAVYRQEGDEIYIHATSYAPNIGLNARVPSISKKTAQVVIEAFANGSAAGGSIDEERMMTSAFARIPDHPDWIADVYVTHNRLTEQLQHIYTTLSIQFNVAGAVLMALLILSNASTLKGIRRLSKGVKLLAEGDMNVMVVQRTGDETESLAHAFNAMAETISKTFVRMENINRSYYRFVPEQLVSLLGAGSIESLGKQSHIRKEMGIMVVRFTFGGGDVSMTTDQLFANINEVIEVAAGAVSRGGGTVYDFAYDGFNAVYDGDSASMISTAIAIRQEILSINQARAGRGAPEVRLVAAMDRGSVMMGMIGDEDRMAPTAISTAINDARELANTCISGNNVNILCTGEVAGDSHCQDGMRCVGSKKLSGRERVLYEIFEGDSYAMRNAKRDSRELFARALELYTQGRYEGAKHMFKEIVKDNPGDGVAAWYLYRADNWVNGLESGEVGR